MNGVQYTLDDIKTMPEGEWRIVVLNRLDKAAGVCDRVRRLEKIAYTAIGMSIILGGVMGWAITAFINHITVNPALLP